MAEFKFRKFGKGSRDYKTLSNMLKLHKELHRAWSFLDEHFGGAKIIDSVCDLQNDFIFSFLELPKDTFDGMTGEGFCRDYWHGVLDDYANDKTSLDNAIELMTKDFDYDV